MGQFLGGTASVPAFLGGFLAGAETGPGAFVTGAGAGYGAYEAVIDIVSDNWHDVVCQQLHDMNAPQSVVDPAVFADPASSPFSEPYQTPYDQYTNDFNTLPVADVTFFDDPSPSGNYGASDLGAGSSFSGDTSGSGYTDFGGSSGGGDSGGPSSD